MKDLLINVKLLKILIKYTIWCRKQQSTITRCLFCTYVIGYHTYVWNDISIPCYRWMKLTAAHYRNNFYFLMIQIWTVSDQGAINIENNLKMTTVKRKNITNVFTINFFPCDIGWKTDKGWYIPEQIYPYAHATCM